MLLLELGIVFLVLIIFIIAKYGIYKIIPNCPIRSWTGLLCPACGGTRCVVNFILGNFKQSFFYHSFLFITLVYLIFINVIYIVNAFKEKEILTFLYPKAKFWTIWGIVLILFTGVRNLI